MLLKLKWWDFPPEELLRFLPELCSDDIPAVREAVRRMLASREA